jgi:hypothetical protein
LLALPLEAICPDGELPWQVAENWSTVERIANLTWEDLGAALDREVRRDVWTRGDGLLRGQWPRRQAAAIATPR